MTLDGGSATPPTADVPTIVDQSDWPAHLRDDAPRQRCNRCRRYTYALSEFGAECRMTQPDGWPCGGRFGSVTT